MRASWILGLGGFLWLVCLRGEAARADELPASDGGLHCAVSGDRVLLSWNIATFRPVEAWVISRDGEVIAELDGSAQGYADQGVPAGEHMYTLAAKGGLDSAGGVLGRCTVVVGDFGLKCAYADGGVDMAWGPIMITIVIQRFIVRRDGEVIAMLPPDASSYRDASPPAGLRRYTVHAQPAPDHEFLVGACTVRVPFEGFMCAVHAPEVLIDWSGVPLPRCGETRCAFDFFRVVRDGEVVADLPPDRFQYEDVPGPGDHHYVVYAGFYVDGADFSDDAPPYYLIGECKVVVPGGVVPPPEELNCLDLDAPAEAEIAELLTRHDVLLVWQKPADYDRVLIARNGELIAVLPGSQFWHVDRDLPPGVYTYAVSGVIGEEVSSPTTCQVRIPRDPVPPPYDLTCQYSGEVEPSPDAKQVDGSVVMRWRNGAAYQSIVIARNGARLARIPGSATSFVDEDPLPGWSAYEVFGVVGIFRSDAASCRVWVPPGLVPPPEDLTCRVLCPVLAEPLPADATLEGDGAPCELDPTTGECIPERCSVFLNWSNPAPYDLILIARNNMQIAVLPGDARSYVDRPPLWGGKIVYSVVGVIGSRRSEAATCEVDITPPWVPPPQNLSCVVYPASVEPEDPAVLAGAGISDDADLTRLPIVKITWINPIRYAAILLSRDGELLAQLPGDAMVYRDLNPGTGHHVYALWGIGAGGVESRRVFCEVDVPDLVVPPVEDLTCVAVVTDSGGPSAALRWFNPADYTSVMILRDGEIVAELPGDATFYLDRNLEPGIYHYAVIAFFGNRRSRPTECRVRIPGPPPENILYFSSGLFEVDPATGEAAAVAENASGRVSCLISNSDPLQGWSFGVCSDPGVLEVAGVDIERTVTQAFNEGEGPSFLSLNRYAQGVTMGVIIDTGDPGDTLPSANSHKVLNIHYGAGPDAAPGGIYPVTYCDSLGDPPVAVLFVVDGFEVAPRTLSGWVHLPMAWPTHIRRGDSNGDDLVDLSDAVATLGWLFLGAEKPGCLEQADANGSGSVNIADPIYTLQFLFIGGPPPPSPFPECGPESTLFLGCEHPSCPQPIGLRG